MIKKVNSFDYFAGADPIWSHIKNGVGDIRMDGGIYHIKNTQYPKYFQYVESLDAHFCGDWCEVSKLDYQKYMYKLLKQKYAEIDELTNMLMEDLHQVE